MVDGVRSVQQGFPSTSGKLPPSAAPTVDGRAAPDWSAGGRWVLHGDDYGGPDQPSRRAADEATGCWAPRRWEDSAVSVWYHLLGA